MKRDFAEKDAKEIERMQKQMESVEMKNERLREEVRKMELERALEKQRNEQNEEMVREMKKREARVALDVERA